MPVVPGSKVAGLLEFRQETWRKGKGSAKMRTGVPRCSAHPRTPGVVALPGATPFYILPSLSSSPADSIPSPGTATSDTIQIFFVNSISRFVPADPGPREYY